MGRSPGGLGRLRVRGGELSLEVLDDQGHHLEVTVPVDAGRVHALHHLHALHADATTRTLPRRPQVDLLLEVVAAVDGEVEALVVEGGPPPRFCLAVRGPFGRREVGLDPVDAAAIIFARRVRLEVRGPVPDWDAALQRLLEP